MNALTKRSQRLLKIVGNPYFIMTVVGVFILYISCTNSYVWADDIGESLKELASEGAKASAEAVNNSVLVKNAKLFSLRSIGMDAIRLTLWCLIKMLYSVSSAAESVLKSITTFFGFAESVAKTNLYTSLLSGVSVALMTATLAYIGIKNILGSEIKYNSVLKNTVIVIILLVGMPNLMSEMNKGANYIWEAVMMSEDPEAQDLSTQVIQDNVYDLYLPLSGKMSFDELKGATPPSAINTKEALSLTNINEYYGTSKKDIPEEFTKSGSDNWEVLQYSIVNTTDGAGSSLVNRPVVKKIEKKGGWFANFIAGGALGTGYYRYTFSTFYIVVTLVGLIIGFGTCAITLAKTYFEMGFQLIAGIPLMATDLETGQKVKHMMQTIINGFLTIAFTSVSFQLFRLTIDWLSKNVDNPMLKLIGLIAAVMMLAQGSKTILNWYGIDLGMQEGFTMSKLMGLRMAEKFVSHLGMPRRGKSSNQEDQIDENKKSEKDSESLDESKKEQDTKSMRENLGDFVHGAAKAGAYAANRGVGGMTEDLTNSLTQKGKDKLSDINDAIRQGVYSTKKAANTFAEDMKSSFEEGQQDGADLAQQNKDSLEARKQANKHNENEYSQKIADLQNQVADNTTDKNINAIQHALSGSMPATQLEGLMKNLESARKMPKAQADEHIQQALKQAEMDLSQSSSPKLEQKENQQQLQQVLASMDSMPYNNSKELQNSLSHALEDSKVHPDQIQRIKQEVEKATKSEPEELKQKVLRMLSDEESIKNSFADEQPFNQKLQSSDQLDRKALSDSLSNADREIAQKVRQQFERAENNSVPDNMTQTIREKLIKEGMSTEGIGQFDQRMSGLKQQQLGKQRQEIEQILRHTLNQVSPEAMPVEQRKMEVQQVLKQADFTQPQQAVQQVIRQIENNALSHVKVEDTKQKVIQELEKATQMYPSQAKDYTQKVLNRANIGSLSTSPLSQIKSDIAPLRNVSQEISQPIAKASYTLYRVPGQTMSEKTANLAQGVYQSAKAPQVVAHQTGKILANSGVSLSAQHQQDIVQRVKTVREKATAENLSDQIVKQRVQQAVTPILSGAGLTGGQVKNLTEHVSNAAIGHTEGTERLARAVNHASMANPSQFRRNIIKQVGSIPQAVQNDLEKIVSEATNQGFNQKETQQYVYKAIKQKNYGSNIVATEAQEKILSAVDSSLCATDPQVQANLKKIGKLEEAYRQQRNE